MPYSNAEDVITSAGVRPTDLGFAVYAELEVWVDGRLEEISDLIDRHIAEEFQGEDAPAGIHGIARQMAVNLIANAVATRSTPVVRIDDWSVRVQQATVFTDDIKHSLSLYRDQPRLHISRVKGHREANA